MVDEKPARTTTGPTTGHTTGHTVLVVNNSCQSHSSVDVEMSDMPKKSARLSMIELGSASSVFYETRDGSAKSGKDYTHTEGMLVSKVACKKPVCLKNHNSFDFSKISRRSCLIKLSLELI